MNIDSGVVWRAPPSACRVKDEVLCMLPNIRGITPSKAELVDFTEGRACVFTGVPVYACVRECISMFCLRYGKLKSQFKPRMDGFKLNRL